MTQAAFPLCKQNKMINILTLKQNAECDLSPHPTMKENLAPSKENLAHYKHPPTSPPPPFAQWDSYKNDYTIHHMYNFRDYISASSSSYRNFRLLDPKSDHIPESLTNLKKNK